MHTKQFYEAPEAELLVVRFEENFCESPYGEGGSAGRQMQDDDEYMYGL